MQGFTGLPISQGLAAGTIVFLGAQEAAARQAGSPQEEQARFAAAQRQAVEALGALYEKAKAELGEKDAEIFSVHQLMAEDEDFTDLVSAAISDGAEASSSAIWYFSASAPVSVSVPSAETLAKTSSPGSRLPSFAVQPPPA